MSLDSLTADEPTLATDARCRRQPSGRYIGHDKAPYMGVRQREPALADEKGAFCVIDCIAGGRLLLFAIPGDREWMRVFLLEADALAPGAKAAAGADEAQRVAA